MADDDQGDGEDDVDIPPEWYKYLELPKGSRSTGDPIDANPFPAGTRYHEVWRRATLEAEAKLATERAKWLDESRALTSIPPSSLEEVDARNQRLRHHHLSLTRYMFDIWAWRFHHVVERPEHLPDFDDWLASYAEAHLKAEALLLNKHQMPDHVAQAFLSQTREILLGRINHWKGGARTRVIALSKKPTEPPVRAPEAQNAAMASQTTTADLSRSVTPKVIQRRRGLLKRFCDDSALTRADLARKTAISESGLRAIVREDRSKFSDPNQAKLLQTLSVTKEDWYAE